MNAINKASQSLMNAIQKAYDQVGNYLDNHPTLYKVVLVACHFFRTVTMFAAMMWMPSPLPVTVGIMVAGSLLYRAAVERFCCFRFTIPSLVGAGAAWLTQIAAVNYLSGAVLTTLGAALHTLAILPLLGYTAWVIYLSHQDIENRMKQLKPAEQNIPILVPGNTPRTTLKPKNCCGHVLQKE